MAQNAHLCLPKPREFFSIWNWFLKETKTTPPPEALLRGVRNKKHCLKTSRHFKENAEMFA